MKRQTLALIAVALLVATTGCLSSVSSSSDTNNSSDTNPIEENTYTFTKPAAGTDKVWSCIAHEKFKGSAGDEQLECELVNETEAY